ncbi:hypothetical protein HUN59_14690 [Curtobacterium sp. Csp2]|uniref:hypothetical protein n=1 Tax=Curtobacterium sp. Csp2 TaxID=2495430 RepID=UPI00157FC5A0|nr:hypothetical protein [Curtobacterium sp. Csp2]QKS17288.1 hypothetical protein HUN59_14690 [Curtobacterium sp. Csp2]
MSFQPTRAERQKYADYEVVVKDAKTHKVHVTVEDGVVIRWTCEIHRYPSSKHFVVFVYPGVTDKERASIERLAANLPRGEWARVPDAWFRRKHRTTGRIFYWQKRGSEAPDPFAQLELELMIDADQSVHQ